MNTKYTKEQRDEFNSIKAQYQEAHSTSYARRIAWGIVFQGLPF